MTKSPVNCVKILLCRCFFLNDERCLLELGFNEMYKLETRKEKVTLNIHIMFDDDMIEKATLAGRTIFDVFSGFQLYQWRIASLNLYLIYVYLLRQFQLHTLDHIKN